MGTYRTAAPAPALVWSRRLESASRVGGSALVAYFGLGRASGTWPNDVGRLAGLLALALAYGWWRVERARRRRSRIEVDVAPGAVSIKNSRGVTKTLERSAMTALVDYGNRLVIRAANPKQGLAIPPDLEHADACRAELRAFGLPAGAPQPRRVWERRGFVLVFWSFLAIFVVQSYPGKLAVAASMLGSLALLFWITPWLYGRRSNRMTTSVDRPSSPTHGSRPLIGVSLIGAGLAAMAIGSWWSAGAGGLAPGFVLIFFGVLLYGAEYFSGSIARGLIAYAVLALSAIAVGLLIDRLLPVWRVGLFAGVTVAGLAALMLLFMTLGRSSSVTSVVDWCVGPFVVAFGMYVAWRGQGASGLLIAVGVIIVAVRVARDRPAAQPWIARLAPVLLVGGLAMLLIAWLQGWNDLALPAVLLVTAASWARSAPPSVSPQGLHGIDAAGSITR